MTNKMTKREVINLMLADDAVNTNETYKAYLENELAILDKKAANKKATKTQEENEVLKAEIMDNVISSEKQTITEMQGKSEKLAALSNQKMSALLRQLVNDGKVTKTMDKKKAYFSLS